jgi:hypothetical protein
VRRLAERLAELAAEVRGGKMRGACERGHVQGIGIARVDEVFRPQQMSGRRMADHLWSEYRLSVTPMLLGNSRERHALLAERVAASLTAIDS